MTDTVVSSATREVVIGFERPFCIIGERINPTGRKRLAAEMAAGDFSQVEADTLAQVAAGAHMLDVNAGIPLADEPTILAETIQLVQSLTDVPLSIDSSIVAALEAGLAVYQGKALVNSVTGEDERLEAVLPLIKKYGAAVVAISNDETGISEDPDVRFEVAKKIVERAEDHGIPRADVVVDPLIMPVGALGQAGRAAFRLIRRLREELRVNTTCGASNVSFGLPNRHGLNSAFLSMAIGAGMTSAIMNPLHPEEMTGIMGADVMLATTPTAAAGSSASASRPPSHEPQRKAPAPRLTMSDCLCRLHAVRQARPVCRGHAAAQAARPLGVDIDCVCGGRALCGRCQVDGRRGQLRQAWHHSTAAPSQRRRRGRGPLSTSRRACRRPPAVLPGPGPGRRGRRRAAREPGAQAGRAQARRGARHRARSRPSACTTSRSSRPDMHRPARRSAAAGGGARRRSGGSARLDLDLADAPRPAEDAAGGRWRVTVAVHDGHRIIAIWPGFHDRAYGHRDRHRLDHHRRPISATSQTGEVLASAGMMNPQIRFGEDLMSRVSYVMMNPGGEVEMTAAVRGRRSTTSSAQVAAEAGDRCQATSWS